MKHLSIAIIGLQLACTSDAASTATTPAEITTTTQPAKTIDDVQSVISTKSTLALAMIEADGKYHVWMQGRSGILRVEAANAFWFKNGGVSLRQGKGQMHMEIDGHVFYTAQPVSTDALSSKINNPPKNNSGFSISLEMTSKGKYITSVIPKNKRPVRIAATTDKPSRSAIITVENPVKLWGVPTSDLQVNEKTSLKTVGKPSKTESIIKPVPATAEETAKIDIELQSIFGGIAKVGWSAKLDLDGDKEIETVICTPTPKLNTCFVMDDVNKQKRYYTTGFKWDGKQHPTIIQLDDKLYLHHSTPLVKGAVHKVLFFNGSGYNSNQL